MAKDILDEQIRDTATYSADVTNEHDGETVFQYVNTLDAEVTLTIYGTNEADTAFNNAVKLGSTTLAAGVNGRDSLSENWDRLRVEAVATTAPTSGSLVVKKHV